VTGDGIARAGVARAGHPVPSGSTMNPAHSSQVPTPEAAVAVTQAWVRKAVIGLNLCPFAKAVESRGRVRYAVSVAHDDDALVADLEREIRRLLAEPAATLGTTLLIHPWALVDFADFNQFLDVADALLAALDCVGEVQVASFHPHYRFAGTADTTSRTAAIAPLPTLHLLQRGKHRRRRRRSPMVDIYRRNTRRRRLAAQAGSPA
jgi:hypothetical protein